MSGPFALYAAHMLKGGYSPVPLWPGKKEPLARKVDPRVPEQPFVRGMVNGWHRLKATALTPAHIAYVAQKWPDAGLGVAGSFNGLVPIDVDTDNEYLAEVIASALPRPSVAKVGRKGWTCFYRAAGDVPKARKFRLHLPGTDTGPPVVEVLTTGQTVLPPTLHPDTGKPYRWLTRATLFTVRVSDLVPITPDHITALGAVLRPWCQRQIESLPTSLAQAGAVTPHRMRAYALASVRGYARRLAGIPPEAGRHNYVLRSGCALGKYVHHGVLSHSEVEAPLVEACRVNGLLKVAGMRNVRQTIADGIARAVNDTLPALGYWARP